MSTLLWLLGFGLMMASFAFLLGRSEQRDTPRITVEPWWPDRQRDRSRLE